MVALLSFRFAINRKLHWTVLVCLEFFYPERCADLVILKNYSL